MVLCISCKTLKNTLNTKEGTDLDEYHFLLNYYFIAYMMHKQLKKATTPIWEPSAFIMWFWNNLYYTKQVDGSLKR